MKHLENLRAKGVPTEAGSRHVFMDNTGYFITFPGDAQGKYHQAMWFKTNKSTRLFKQYPLDGMMSFPDGQSIGELSRNASTSSKGHAEGNLIEGESAILDAGDVNFSIRGAAFVGSRPPAVAASRAETAGESEFSIRGAAATSSPASARPPTEAFVERNTHNDRTFSPHISNSDLFANTMAVSRETQERDDAASSVSGVAGSDVSGSKTPKCHVCQVRTGILVKCPTCKHHYHRHCLTDPSIMQHLSSEWQCQRPKCKKKRSSSQASSPVFGPNTNAQKKQRVSCPDTVPPNMVVGAHPVLLESTTATQPMLLSTIPPPTGSHGEGSSTVLADDEADSLVAESFAPAPAGVPKKGGKLKAVKHKTSVPGLEERGNERGVMNTPIPNKSQPASVANDEKGDHVGAPISRPQPCSSNPRIIAEESFHPLKVQAAATLKSSYNTSHLRNGIGSASPLSDRGDGRKAKKTHVPKADKTKIKCTSCKVRVVPPNPFGRTICHECKDSGVEKAVRISLDAEAVKPTKRSVQELDKSEHSSGAASAVQASNAAQVDDGSEAISGTSPGPSDLTQTGGMATAKEGTADQFVRTSLESGAHATTTPMVVTTPAATTTISVDSPIASNSAQKQSMNHIVDADAMDVDNEPHAQKDNGEPLSSSGSTDEDDMALSTLGSKRALNPKLGSRPSVPEKKSKHQKTRQPKEAGYFVNLDSTDEDDDVPLSTFLSKQIPTPKRGTSLPVKKGRASHVRVTQVVEAKDQYDLGGSFKRPKGTYARLINMALSDAIDGSLRPNEITQWISKNIPGYDLKHGTWAEGVKSTLIFKSDTSGKNGVATLKRSGPGGSEDWYELLPEWKDKVERWDAVLALPRSPLAKATGDPLPAAIFPQAMPSAGPADQSPSNSAAKTRATVTRRSTEKVKEKQRKQPPAGCPSKKIMERNSNPNVTNNESKADGEFVDDDSSSDQPLAQMGSNRRASDNDSLFAEDMENVCNSPRLRGTDRQSVADNAYVGDLFRETAAVPQASEDRGNPSQKKQPYSIHDMTLEQVLACRPPAVHTEFNKAWPSLDPKKMDFDYDAKRAEIRARPGRKARFGQKRPVDVEKVLATVGGPSKLPPWPPIDNSLGLTQEQLGDELILEPCETWEEFFGTTEEVKPCIIDGKLAFRPVGGKSRAVYKTNI